MFQGQINHSCLLNNTTRFIENTFFIRNKIISSYRHPVSSSSPAATSARFIHPNKVDRSPADLQPDCVAPPGGCVLKQPQGVYTCC